MLPVVSNAMRYATAEDGIEISVCDHLDDHVRLRNIRCGDSQTGGYQHECDPYHPGDNTKQQASTATGGIIEGLRR